MAPCRRLPAAPLALALGALCAPPAWAADDAAQDPQPSAQANRQDAAPATAQQQELQARLAKFHHFDELGESGLTTNFPLPAIDSVLQDAGGWRSALAQHDIGVQTQFVFDVTDGLLSTGQPAHPQMYNGQRFTVSTITAESDVTFGLASWGLPNSKITVGAHVLANTFHAGGGPNTGEIRALYYYQSFGDGRYEAKVGWIANIWEYAGLFMGGSPVLANGISALIPIEVGLSSDTATTPAINLTAHGDHGEYVRIGVQRSVSPEGNNYETEHHNFWGLKIHQPGAGPLYIGEVGLKRDASGSHHQIWLRGGYMYNDSDYTSFVNGRTKANRATYAAGDYQLTQINSGMPFRGLYVGASAAWAPKELNVYSTNYEVRAYYVGPFDGRPTDAITFRAYYNKFSGPAQRALAMEGLFTNPDQKGYEVGYAYHVTHGVHLLPALAYIEHPSFVGDFKDALIASLNLYMEF
ncbi:hypothetical protein BV497_10785 [Fulvimonas soli]|nr:hypothetical protein BV497_10785 [Fulvimonas soli]